MDQCLLALFSKSNSRTISFSPVPDRTLTSLKTRTRQSASSLFPLGKEWEVKDGLGERGKERQGGPGPSPRQSSLRLAQWHTAFFPKNPPTHATFWIPKTTRNSGKTPRPWLVSCSTNAKKKFFFSTLLPRRSPPSSVLIIIVVEFETLLQPLEWGGSISVCEGVTRRPQHPRLRFRRGTRVLRLPHLLAGAAPHGWPKRRQHIWRGSHTSPEFEAWGKQRNGKLKWKKSGNRNGLHCGLIRQLISNKKLWQASKGAVDGDFKYISCKENVTLWISHYLRSHLFAQCRGGVIGLGPGYMCSPTPAVFVCSFVLRFNEGYAAWLTSKHPIPSSRPFIEIFFFFVYIS